jgi:hypothetical protein
LGREVRDQLDLLVSEGTNLLTINDDRANKLVLLEHGHGDEGAGAGEFDGGDAQWLALAVSLLRGDIGNVDQSLGL